MKHSPYSGPGSLLSFSLLLSLSPSSTLPASSLFYPISLWPGVTGSTTGESSQLYFEWCVALLRSCLVQIQTRCVRPSGVFVNKHFISKKFLSFYIFWMAYCCTFKVNTRQLIFLLHNTNFCKTNLPYKNINTNVHTGEKDKKELQDYSFMKMYTLCMYCNCK